MKIPGYLVMFLALGAHAHDFKVGDLRVVHPFAVPTVAGASTGALYFALENTGNAADRLVAAATSRARRIELHSMSTEGGVMRMREVNDIEVKPGQAIKMRPGSAFHLMLMELTLPLKEGETFPVTLTFEKSGKVEVKACVQTPKGNAMEHKH